MGAPLRQTMTGRGPTCTRGQTPRSRPSIRLAGWSLIAVGVLIVIGAVITIVIRRRAIGLASVGVLAGLCIKTGIGLR